MDIESYWSVYIIQTTCNKLYTGITTDVDRRFQEHCDIYHGKNAKGAKFFRGHEPLKVVHIETCATRSEASKREFQIKKMSKRVKLNLFSFSR